MEVDALKSELLEELDIMILFACGMHVSSTFLIVLFHIRELLYTAVLSCDLKIEFWQTFEEV